MEIGECDYEMGPLSTKSQTSMSDGDPPQHPGSLESAVIRVGEELVTRLNRLLAQVPGADSGPQRLATVLGIDKVLASRLLKAVRSPDAMSVMHRAPGPAPLRRVLQAVERHGVSRDDLAAAHSAVNRFEDLIRDGGGDRSSLEAILSAWVPDARREFELRRKQAAFRAMSQLKGVQVDAAAETAIFWPNENGTHIDVVWIKAMIGLAQLRPGAAIKYTTKRGVESPTERRPLTLDGEQVELFHSAMIGEFCSQPVPELTAKVVGETTHYLLDGLGLGNAVRLVTCEVNRAEIARYVPTSRGRRAWASAEIVIPAEFLQFDVLMHLDCYPGEHPDLRVYDTAALGPADRNDPTRDIDQFDLLDSVTQLGVGISRFGSGEVPSYRRILEHVCGKLGFDGSKLRGYRVASAYPIYGAQFALSFRTTDPPVPN